MLNLPNEIILKIIKELTFKDIIKLKYINKYFNKYFQSYKKQLVLNKSKLLYNIKHTLLYTCNMKNNPIRKLIDLIDRKKYDFSDFYKTKILDNITVPSILHKFDNTNQIPLFGDIISSFIIKGKNISKVELFFCNICVKKCHYINAKLINFKPFDCGIILVSLCWIPFQKIL